MYVEPAFHFTDQAGANDLHHPDSRLVKSQGQQSRGFAFTSVIHALFLPALWAYLRVFFASPRLVKQPGEETFRDFLLEGAPLYQPPLEPPIEIKEKRILFECDAQGEPMRCFRDECQGRWKPARYVSCCSELSTSSI